MDLSKRKMVGHGHGWGGWFCVPRTDCVLKCSSAMYLPQAPVDLLPTDVNTSSSALEFARAPFHFARYILPLHTSFISISSMSVLVTSYQAF